MTATSFFESVSADVFTQLVASDQSDAQISIAVDGHSRQFSLSRFAITRGQTAIGRVVVLRDISALKQRETQLTAQNERLNEFADIVSHDLQGPLMEIRGSADMALSTGDVAHLERVIDATDRIDELITDLLQLAHTGRQLDVKEPVDIDETAAAAWSHVWSPNGKLLGKTGRTVTGDPSRIQQLFENVFHNAIEHSGRGEQSQRSRDSIDVHVTVGPLPDGFYIEDDGPGIPQEKRDRVFEKGYTNTSTGTGIGLSIVRQIVDAHGWSIRLTEGTNGGARFEITGVE